MIYMYTTNSSNSNIKWHFRLQTVMLSLYRMKEKQTGQ